MLGDQLGDGVDLEVAEGGLDALHEAAEGGADQSKLVDVLGKFPLPVEVIPMARSYVARQLVKLGGNPVLRTGFTTDNGNVILDVHGMSILDPVAMEAEINQLVGVVTVGLFARRGADVFLMGTPEGVKTLTR